MASSNFKPIEAVFKALQDFEVDEQYIKEMNDYKDHYVSYDDQIKMSHSLKELTEILDEMLRENYYPDSYCFASCLKKLPPELAKEMFVIVIQKNLANAVTYNTMLDVIAKSSDPDMKLAKKVLKEAEGLGFVNEFTYNIMLNVIAQSSKPDVRLARRILKESESRGFANEFTYSAMLNVIAQSSYPYVALAKLELAKQILDESESLGLVNVLMYNTMLNVISRTAEPDMDLAKELFNKAKSRGLADVITYATMLKVIAKSLVPNVELAGRVLKEAERERLVNSVTYSTMLNVIAASDEPNMKLAAAILGEAERRGLVNKIIYSSMLDVAMKISPPDMKLVQQILTKGEDLFKEHVKEDQKKIVYDLHGLSEGAAYFFLLQELIKLSVLKSILPIVIIYGRGLHSKSDLEKTHPLKRAVQKVMAKMGPDIATQEENKRNPGQSMVNFNPLRLKVGEKDPVTSVPKPHPVLPKTGGSKFKLNPNATEFKYGVFEKNPAPLSPLEERKKPGKTKTGGK